MKHSGRPEITSRSPSDFLYCGVENVAVATAPVGLEIHSAHIQIMMMDDGATALRTCPKTTLNIVDDSTFGLQDPQTEVTDSRAAGRLNGTESRQVTQHCGTGHLNFIRSIFNIRFPT
jgi:hypothetical protein